MASANKSTLESIVTRFRREVEKQEAAGSSTELEVRLQDVSYANFAAIYEVLLVKVDAAGEPFAVGDGSLVQMISAIMNIHLARGEGPQRHLQPMRIREIYYEKGQRVRERFVHKGPLVPSVRIPSASALAYVVALSGERDDTHGFSADEGAVIRVKARMSFPLTLVGTSEVRPQLDWRIDMTVVREIMGSDADTALSRIVEQMFRTNPAMTPANFLSVLRLADDDNPAARKLYKYEVEAELVGPSGGLDAVRPSDVTASAETILRLANPEYVREAAMQAEVYRAAQYIIKAPGYLRQFQHELGLKRLLPQANAITRADYRAIYPPKGFYLTEKADGKRAVAVVHDGRGVVIADTLHEFAEAGGGVPASARGGVPASVRGREPSARLLNDTIVDGELVQRGGRAGQPIPASPPAPTPTPTPTPTYEFYAFDLIAIAGENVTNDSFKKRLDRLAEAVSILAEAGIPAFAKQYTHIVDDSPAYLEETIQGVYSAKHQYAVDGLIFVEPGKPYENTANYKWKSAHDNTIDFLARRAPASVLGREPYVDRPGHKVHFLFVGITPELYEALGLQWCPGYADLFGTTGPLAKRAGKGDHPDRMDVNTGSYFPIQFSPSDTPLAYVYQHPDNSPLGDIDAKVVEGRCAGNCPAAGGGVPLVEWDMLRIREDRRRDLLSKRYYGNDYYTAELIWLNYVDPFPVEQLWEGPSLDYFLRPKSGDYKAQTALISYMKTERILTLKHANWVVDIGTGKGQDLGRYLDAEVHHLVAIDQDRAALSELVRRKYSFAGRGRTGTELSSESDASAPPTHPGRRRGAHTATTLHILVADAGEPHLGTLAKLKGLGLQRETADAVVCNLAVHYFLGSLDSLRNFVALARGAVKVGGRVIITAFLGEKVHKLFLEKKVPVDGTWEIRENDRAIPKYALKRLYSSSVLEAVGQRIGVMLPFSEGRYYDEYLVNTKNLITEFNARHFLLEARTNADELIRGFEGRNRTLAELLTEGDKLYLSLYGELVFRREK